MRDRGHAVLDAMSLAALAATPLADFAALGASWNDLPPDRYLRDGGRYRRRRHASYVVDGDAVRDVPHRAHWQPVDYNALHGGIERWFEPVEPAVAQSTAWRQLLRALGALASGLRSAQPWFVEAHQFRIDTTDGIGRPTPEGAHRDGVDLVAVILVAREGIKGAETRVFDAAGPAGLRFTLREPWSCLLLDDARVIHESTPIQPTGAHGHRDTLVVTLRRGGFQDPAPTA
nr:2OG-Fe dioxygenase family protein [Schlegelella koreensis]